MTPKQSPIIETLEGKIQGIAEQDAFAFKGIRYAEPPIGELRWRPPRSVAHAKNVRQADKFGNASLQDVAECKRNGGGDPSPIDEDCLFLNVWTPHSGPGSKVSLPVMVWIHGGAFAIGAGGAEKMPVYNGAPLASRGVVVVS